MLLGAVSFLLAAALWWISFDLASAGAKKLLFERGGAGRGVTACLPYGHLFTALGLAAVGVGIEHVILESILCSETSPGTSLVLCGGVALSSWPRSAR